METEATKLVTQFGLAGVLAWLFWWTLRRTMEQHDRAISAAKEEMIRMIESADRAAERFAQVVDNHFAANTAALERVRQGLDEVCRRLNGGR